MPPGDHLASVQGLVVTGTRFELRHPTAQLMDCAWSGPTAHITFQNISDGSQSFRDWAADATTVLLRPASGALPTVKFLNSELMGHHLVQQAAVRRRPRGLRRLQLQQLRLAAASGRTGSCATTATHRRTGSSTVTELPTPPAERPVRRRSGSGGASRGRPKPRRPRPGRGDGTHVVEHQRRRASEGDRDTATIAFCRTSIPAS